MSPDPSVREQILTELLERIERITVANGFATDAGKVVAMGETPELGADDPDFAIAIVPGADQPTDEGTVTAIRWPISIQALAKVGSSPTLWMTIEAMVADIKRAVECGSRSLGGLLIRDLARGQTRTVPREPGSETVGVGVEYLASFIETWGAP